jgi:hypothetical protein
MLSSRFAAELYFIAQPVGSALPRGILALLSDLVQSEEETTILESRKDRKSAAPHSAISSPTGSRDLPFTVFSDVGAEQRQTITVNLL